MYRYIGTGGVEIIVQSFTVYGICESIIVKIKRTEKSKVSAQKIARTRPPPIAAPFQKFVNRAIGR